MPPFVDMRSSSSVHSCSYFTRNAALQTRNSIWRAKQSDTLAETLFHGIEVLLMCHELLWLPPWIQRILPNPAHISTPYAVASLFMILVDYTPLDRSHVGNADSTSHGSLPSLRFSNGSPSARHSKHMDHLLVHRGRLRKIVYARHDSLSLCSVEPCGTAWDDAVFILAFASRPDGSRHRLALKLLCEATLHWVWLATESLHTNISILRLLHISHITPYCSRATIRRTITQNTHSTGRCASCHRV